jgi:hypothetical protein
MWPWGRATACAKWYSFDGLLCFAHWELLGRLYVLGGDQGVVQRAQDGC